MWDFLKFIIPALFVISIFIIDILDFIIFESIKGFFKSFKGMP